MGIVDVIVEGIARRVRARARRGKRWSQPLGLKRILIDGKVYLVRKVVGITPNEIIVIDHTGAVKAIPRGTSEGTPIAYKVRK